MFDGDFSMSKINAIPSIASIVSHKFVTFTEFVQLSVIPKLRDIDDRLNNCICVM